MTERRLLVMRHAKSSWDWSQWNNGALEFTLDDGDLEAEIARVEGLGAAGDVAVDVRVSTGLPPVATDADTLAPESGIMLAGSVELVTPTAEP